MKITKKELFMFCDENNDAINELQSQSDSTDFLLAVLIQQLKDSGVIDEISPEPKPRLKQLDQSVFNGLDEKWRFAAVDSNGDAIKYTLRVEPHTKVGEFVLGDNSVRNNLVKNFSHQLIGEGYDASNWQDSLIEREKKELTGSELCKAMLERGDKCVMIRMGARDDKQARDIGRFAIATGIDESGRFNVMSDQQPISKVDFAAPINNQGEPLTAREVGL